MVYRLDIEEDFDHTPVTDGFGSEIIRFQLGEDFELDFVVYMTVFFALKEEGIYELRFGTEERRLSRENFSEGLDYSIEQSKRYVPSAHRPRVLGLLLEAIKAILAMQSFYANLQDKALIKYDKIATLMNENGYETAQDFVGNNGRRYWLFKIPD
jgi:hypothetical protein